MKFIFHICLAFVFLFFSCSGKIEPRTQTAMDTLCTVNAFEDGTKKLYDEIEHAQNREEIIHLLNLCRETEAEGGNYD